MKRLLLFAVFMTLPALWQYAGAQVTLQAVDAGFTDGKWWIDLKNPGSTDLSGNGGENDKLGICFYIESQVGRQQPTTRLQCDGMMKKHGQSLPVVRPALPKLEAVITIWMV